MFSSNQLTFHVPIVCTFCYYDGYVLDLLHKMKKPLDDIRWYFLIAAQNKLKWPKTINKDDFVFHQHKMKNKKYHTVRTVSEFSRNIVEIKSKTKNITLSKQF